jgi:hypothetical protein
VSQKAHRHRDFDLAQGSHQMALVVYRFCSNDQYRSQTRYLYPTDLEDEGEGARV